MDIKEIKAVIDLMRKNSLTEFEYEKDGTKIRIQRGPDGKPQVFSSSPNLLATPTLVPIPTALPAAPLAPSPTPPAESLPTINSPMVGTFYGSPAPDAPAYISVGSAVTPRKRRLHHRGHEGHERDQSRNVRHDYRNSSRKW